MHHLRSITIDALTEEVLLRLRTNRAQHAQIVEEAWAGFAIKAAHALKERLKEIEKGRRIGTTFRLQGRIWVSAEADATPRCLVCKCDMTETAGDEDAEERYCDPCAAAAFAKDAIKDHTHSARRSARPTERM
jgi:hypothetical protein